MSAGRVTIMCNWRGAFGCGQERPATQLHGMLQATNNGNWWCFVCDSCGVHSKEYDSRENFAKTKRRPVYWTLLNPGLCTPEEDCEVEIAISILMRLLRSQGDSIDAVEDRQRLHAAGEAMQGAWYERCEGWGCVGGHILTNVTSYACQYCNGSGLVLRRDRRAA